MPLILAVLLLVGGFIWWAWGRNRAGAVVASRLDRLFRRNPCRWERTGDRSGRFTEYRCSVCGVAAYSATGKSPVTCKRNIRSNG